MKWNISMGNFNDKVKLDCKSVIGINSNCVVGYKRPFNDVNSNISDWTINKTRIDNLLVIGNIGFTPFD